jgi:hypothetical protein
MQRVTLRNRDKIGEAKVGVGDAFVYGFFQGRPQVAEQFDGFCPFYVNFSEVLL